MKKFFSKIADWWRRHKPSKRRLIQIYAALLYNANLKGFGSGRIYTGGSKNFCVPGLNCYSCPGAVGACPLGALQNALASSGTRAPFYVFGIIILLGLLLGRTICGWLCPLGLGQELLYKIKSPKLRKNRFTRVLSYFKYVLLLIFVVAIPLAYSPLQIPVPAFCKYICPQGTLEGGIGLLFNINNSDYFAMLGPLFTWKFIVLVALCVLSVFIFRVFCRFICPLGAIYGFFSKIALIGVKLDKTKCTDCGLCVTACKMDIRHVGDHECIHCGACVPVCPTAAISWKGSKVMLKPNAIELASAEKEYAASEKEAASSLSSMLRPVQSSEQSAEREQAEVVQEKTREEKPILAISHEDEGFTQIVRKKVEKRNLLLRVVAWVLALGVLVGALVYYNFIDKEKQLPVGNQIGDLCPDFTLENIVTGENYNLYENRGKVTLINFWATWCGPCVTELPEFEKLTANYEVTVLAVHSVNVTDDVKKWLSEKTDENGNAWASWNVTFLQDRENVSETLNLYDLLGGKGAYPVTVVLDGEGVISAVQQGSVTYEWLENAFSQANA